MTVRLGFAIAAHLEPEILVVDEVLAVGDAEFQKKAIGKMQDVSRGEGRTVLFVSHNMGAVKNLCTRGIVLDQGKIARIGDIDSTISFYLKLAEAQEKHTNLINQEREKGYNSEIVFTDIKFLDIDNNEIQPCCGKNLKIRIFFKSLKRTSKARFSLAIRDILDRTLLSFPTDLTIPNINLKEGNSFADLIIENLPLTAGDYKIALHASNAGIACDYLDSAKKLTVIDGDFFKQHLPIPNYLSGKIVLCNHRWNIGE